MDLFIGRERELRASLDLLATEGDGTVQDIMCVHGMGKSTYLARLAELARELDLPGLTTTALSIDMKRYGYGEGYISDLGASASADMLWYVLTRSRQLMTEFAAGREEFHQFSLLARGVVQESEKIQGGADAEHARLAELNVAKRGRIDKAEVIIHVKQDEGTIRQRIRSLQSQLDDEFVRAWNRFTVRRRVLITLDSFQLVADDELGQWFVRMAMRLRNTLTVLARTPTDDHLWRDPAALHPLSLTLFTRDEVAEYLRRRLKTDADVTGLAGITHDYTDGHPGGVNLVGDLIINTGGADLAPARLHHLLDGLPSDGDQRWAELVKLVLEVIQEPVLLRAVDAASVAATFDGGLLAELIDPGHPADVDSAAIISRLIGLRMLQEIPAISGGSSGRFRLHEFIRQSVSRRLETTTYDAWRNLHAAAAGYYFRLLQDWEDEPYESYGAWYRFEAPAWQECKREWLQHAGLADSRDPITRARFTLVFLEAFWWWGYYLPFPFMRQLLEDWSRAAAQWERRPTTQPGQHENLNQVFLTTLTDLINDYPVSHIKPPTAPWDAIYHNLRTVRRLCGLNPTGGLNPPMARRLSDQEKVEMSRADAYITLFMAQSRRFRDPADPQAEALYDTATGTFGELGDEWTGAWIIFERADLALERRDLAEAARRVAKGAAAARDYAEATAEWDRELLANLHRTWADICWLSHRADEAAAGYGRAVANAYWFHGEPTGTDGESHGPDDYTQQFYLEMTLRAAERIIELGDRPAEQERFVSEMLRHVPGRPAAVPAASLVAADTAAIRQKLFPPSPDDSEMRLLTTDFMTRWDDLYPGSEDPAAGLADLITGATAGQ